MSVEYIREVLAAHKGDFPTLRTALNGQSISVRENVLLRARDNATLTVWALSQPVQDGDVVTSVGYCVDPVAGHLYTTPEGKPAMLWELLHTPDYVAGARLPDPHHWEFFSKGPKALNLQIGDICNAKCIMCWQSLRRDADEKEAWHKEMKADVVANALARHFDTLESIELVSFGEPMANPHFEGMVTAMELTNLKRTSVGRKPIGLNLITNGSLLDRHLRVVEAPGFLTLSIDAVGDLYERIRVGLSWDRLVRNIEKAVAHPRRHRERWFGINLTLFEDNADQVMELATLCDKYGFTYLSLLHGANMKTTKAVGREIAANDARVVQGLTEVRERFPSLQINDYMTQGTSLLAVQGLALQKGRTFCPLPWRQYDFGPDGEGHPCCRSYYTNLGDSTKDVWHGEVLETLRAQILNDDVDPVQFKDCAGCSNLGAKVRSSRSLPVL